MDTNPKNFTIATGSSLTSLLGNNKRLESLSAWTYDSKTLEKERNRKTPKPIPSESPKMRNHFRISFKRTPKASPPELSTLKMNILPISAPKNSPYTLEPRFRNSESRKVKSRKSLKSNTNLSSSFYGSVERPGSGMNPKNIETPGKKSRESTPQKNELDQRAQSAVKHYREELEKKIKQNENSYDPKGFFAKSVNISIDSEQLMSTTMTSSLNFEPKLKPKHDPFGRELRSRRSEKPVLKARTVNPREYNQAKQTIDAENKNFYFHKRFTNRSTERREPSTQNNFYKPKNVLNNSMCITPKYTRAVILGRSYLIENKFNFSVKDSKNSKIANHLNSRPVIDYQNQPSGKIKNYLKVLSSRSPNHSLNHSIDYSQSQTPSKCPTPRIMINSPLCKRREPAEPTPLILNKSLLKHEFFNSKDNFTPHHDKYFGDSSKEYANNDNSNKTTEVEGNLRARSLSIEPWGNMGIKYVDPWIQPNNI